tara:strand:- start:853 stop:1380 length:528 start_codon:yes stop_codon:yes gene_type:complete
MIFDFIQHKITKTSFISPEKLITKNRKDIEFRIQFLKDVIDHGISPKKTLYYQFISDSGTGGGIDGGSDPEKFLSLFKNIQEKNITEPLAVANYLGKKIKTRYFLNEEKNWVEIINEGNLQLINGAHRLAIAYFLGMEKIPVKVYRSFSFEVPNYTEYIKIQEKNYQRNLSKEKN